jgi:hypothetical protein
MAEELPNRPAIIELSRLRLENQHIRGSPPKLRVTLQCPHIRIERRCEVDNRVPIRREEHGKSDKQRDLIAWARGNEEKNLPRSANLRKALAARINQIISDNTKSAGKLSGNIRDITVGTDEVAAGGRVVAFERVNVAIVADAPVGTGCGAHQMTLLMRTWLSNFRAMVAYRNLTAIDRSQLTNQRVNFL